MREGTWGLGRRRGLQKDFHVGDQQVVNLRRHLRLTGCDLPYGLPQRDDVQRYLLYLLRAEGSGDGRRHLIRSSCDFRPAGSFIQPSCSTQLAIVCFASGDQPSSGTVVA